MQEHFESIVLFNSVSIICMCSPYIHNIHPYNVIFLEIGISLVQFFTRSNAALLCL